MSTFVIYKATGVPEFNLVQSFCSHHLTYYFNTGHIKSSCKMFSKLLYELPLTRNLALISTSPRRLLDGRRLGRLTTLKRSDSCENGLPLCIIPSWLGANKSHLMKYAQYYLDQDFDVLLYMSTVSQVFSTASSAKTMAIDALEFCHNNQQHYGPTVVHGFSVGATAWGCLLTCVGENPERYNFLHDKIVGQVWDSPFFEMDRLPEIGGLMAFPNSPLLQKTVQRFLQFQMKLQSPESNFQKTAESFHNLNTKTSFLLFTSEDDSISLYSVVAKCAEGWQKQGCKVNRKIWEYSPHVRHFKKNPEEYTTSLKDFLQRVSLLKYPERFQIAKKITTESEEAVPL